jgi:hypothetical protein
MTLQPETTAVSCNLATGDVFERKYSIVAKIGEGGFGAVYRATQAELQRTVAIKLIRPAIVSQWDSVERFEREAMALAALQHKNIPTIYEYRLTANNIAYIAMEFCPGTTLRTHLDKVQNLSPAEFLDVFSQLCSALDAAHCAGIVHRDLKPSNLIISPEGDLKVIDFGLIKLLPRDGLDVQKLTQTGLLVGSPDYMSPEQCRGEVPTTLSDIYAVGCLMYEACTGVKVFEADNPMGILYKHCNEEPTFTLEKYGETGRVFAHVIRQAMAKQPADRIQSAAMLKEELDRASKTAVTADVVQPVAAPANNKSSKSWRSLGRRQWLACLIPLTLALGSIAMWLFAGSGVQDDQPSLAVQERLVRINQSLAKHDVNQATNLYREIKQILAVNPKLSIQPVANAVLIAELNILTARGELGPVKKAIEHAYRNYHSSGSLSDRMVKLALTKLLLESKTEVSNASTFSASEIQHLARQMENLVDNLPHCLETGFCLIEAGECYRLARNPDLQSIDRICYKLDHWQLADQKKQAVLSRHLCLLKAHSHIDRKNWTAAVHQLGLAVHQFPTTDMVEIQNYHKLYVLSVLLKKPAEAEKYERNRTETERAVASQLVQPSQPGTEWQIRAPGH